MAIDQYHSINLKTHDAIHADDLEHIENGIENNNANVRQLEEVFSEHKNALDRQRVKIDDLKNRLTVVENREVETANGLTSLESSHDSFAQIAVTEENLDDELKDRMSVVSRTMNIAGQKLTIEWKNDKKCTFEKSYYKRTSTGEVTFVATCTTGPVKHYLQEYFTFELGDLDSGTNDMIDKDIRKFATVTRNAGIAAYSYSFLIRNGKLCITLGVWGLGEIAVEAGVKVEIKAGNDSDFVLDA